MTDISDISGKGLPTSAALLKATGVAALVAGAILVAAVLPAEFGIDPTGIGKRLGLTALSRSSASGLSDQADGPVWKQPAAYRSDELRVTLAPDEGAEIKAAMQAGERLVFAWGAEGGKVSFDMHGEEPGAASDEFTSYWKERNSTGANGAFVAPFAGSHGWYWKNRGDAPVTVTVRTSGYYEKLYRP